MRYFIFVLFLSTSLLAATRYDRIVNKINELEKAYPHLVKKISIGINNNGNQIYGMRISSTPDIMDPQKLGMLVVGTHHGNEGETADIVVNFAKGIVKNLDSNKEFYLIPVLNIPGYNQNSRLENGVDPNRDYPSPCKMYSSYNLRSTKALADLMQSRSFVGSVTLHGFIGIIAYPWGISTANIETEDNALFIDLSRVVAAAANYAYGNSAVDIYPADGCFEDWAYWKTGAWSLLFEIRDGSEQDIQANVEALEVYFKNVPTTESVNHEFNGVCTPERFDTSARY